MRFDIKKTGAVAVLASSVLLTAACSSSGTISSAGTGAGATSPGTSASTSASPSSAAGSAAATSSAAAPATSSTDGSSSSAAPGGSGTAMTSDQLAKSLLTDKDAPGYTFDAANDGNSTQDTQEKVTTGGASCQLFIDATDELSTKYGTVAQADRQLTKSAENHVIETALMSFPSADKAKAVVADIKKAVAGCKSLKATTSSGETSMQIATIPQVSALPNEAGYILNLTDNGNTVMVATMTVQVGNATASVALVGPVTSDTAQLQSMGETLGTLSAITVGRLKAAQGG